MSSSLMVDQFFQAKNRQAHASRFPVPEPHWSSEFPDSFKQVSTFLNMAGRFFYEKISEKSQVLLSSGHQQVNL